MPRNDHIHYLHDNDLDDDNRHGHDHYDDDHHHIHWHNHDSNHDLHDDHHNPRDVCLRGERLARPTPKRRMG